MDWQPYITAYAVRCVLQGLVALPALGVSVLALRTPGYKHDHTRRWVDFTKAALGLWSISELLGLVGWITWTVVLSRRQNGSYLEEEATQYISIVGSLLGTLAQVAIFLAFFFLIHALAQLRTGTPADDSRAFLVGRKVVFGGSALVVLVEMAVFCCDIAWRVLYKILRESRDRYVPGDWDNMIRLSLAVQYMTASNSCIFFVAAIGMTIYAFQAQKEARGSPVQKAATLLLGAVSLWLVARLWSFIMTVMMLARYWWFYAPLTSAYSSIIDAFLFVWTTFAALMILYILASKNAYGLSRVHYQDQDDEQRVLEDEI